MSDDYIGVKIDGVIYVKLDDVKPMRTRIEKLEVALEDALQYVSRADWHYLKDETRKALEVKDD